MMMIIIINVARNVTNSAAKIFKKPLCLWLVQFFKPEQKPYDLLELGHKLRPQFFQAWATDFRQFLV